MLVELMYMLNAGAEDATIGVNAQITGGSVISGHAAPDAVTVYNQIEHSWVARRKLNTEDAGVTFPALAIFQGGPGVLEPEVGTIYRRGDYPIVFAQIRKKSDSALGFRQAGYTNRAVYRFLRDFMENAQTATMRTQNGIIISQLTQLGEPPVIEDWDKVEVVAAVTATFKLRETSP
mgnify:CR=1 FL=1